MMGVHRLMAMLIYGCGLRLQECLGLRIKDIDLEQNLIMIRAGKGDKDRRTVSSHPSCCPTEGIQDGYRKGGYDEASFSAYAEAQFCHASPGKWL